GDKFFDAGEQRIAERKCFRAEPVAPPERELPGEPTLAEELGPARELAVRLRRAADVVVTMPAERIARPPMQLRERGAEPPCRVRRLGAELDPLEREEGVGTGGAAGEDLGNGDGARGAQRVEPFGFRFEPVGRAARLELQ